MNRYGRVAQSHWQQTDPERYAALEDPTEFFSTLGLQVEARVQELLASLAGPDVPGEAYLEKVGRLNMAQKQAEEAALAELVWLDSDQDEPDPPSETDRFLWEIHDAMNDEEGSDTRQ